MWKRHPLAALLTGALLLTVQDGARAGQPLGATTAVAPGSLPFAQGYSSAASEACRSCGAIGYHGGALSGGPQGGCREHHEYYWGYLHGWCERPFGSLLQAQMQAQVVNGMAAQMALYAYDFHDAEGPHAALLTPRGRRQVEKMSKVLPYHFFPVMVESTGSDELDLQRRTQVFEALLALECPVTLEQIVTGRTDAHGVSGIESVLVYENLLRQTQAGGVGLTNSGVSSGGSASGSNAAGFSGATGGGGSGTSASGTSAFGG